MIRFSVVFLIYTLAFSFNAYSEVYKKLKIDPYYNVRACFEKEVRNNFGQNCNFNNASETKLIKIQEDCISDPNSNVKIKDLAQLSLDEILVDILNSSATGCQSEIKFEVSDESISLVNFNPANPSNIENYDPLTEGDSEEASE